MYSKQILLLVLIIFLASCTNPITDSDTGEGIKLYTLKNGSVLEPGSPVPVTLVYDESADNFDYLKISLYSDDGTLVSSKIIYRKDTENSRKNEIDLPENLSKGLYHLKFEAFRQEKPVFSSTSSFFSDRGLYRLDKVQSYPPNPAPEEKVYIAADFTAPAGTDPYFRWTIAGKTVLEGFSSKGAGRINWKTPASEGAYPLSVELFPFAPSDTVFESFVSAMLNESVIFVSESNRGRGGQFFPESSYLTLFHFRGEIRDTGYNASGNGYNYTIKGDPLPDIKGSVYGFRFTSDDALIIPAMALPLTRQGFLQPFTVKFRFLPDLSTMNDSAASDTGTTALLKIASEDKNFSLTVKNPDRNQYSVELTYGSRVFAEDVVLQHSSNNLVNMALSFYTERNHATLVWMVNGETLSRASIPFLPVIASPAGTTEIGGGYSSILYDEAGIYARDVNNAPAVDAGGFSDYLSETFRNDLLMAEGFDNMEMPFTFSTGGDVEFEAGFVKLPPGGWIVAGEKILLPDSSEISVIGKCTVIVRDKSGREVFSGNATDGVSVFALNNAAPGEYDIILANNSEREINLVDNIAVTRAVSGLAGNTP